ncbi:sensor histidine kinase [Nocardiopsis tropica]|uniref:histidine kinase n=1 Tax=Nocardiopsis tropica TaxID=109330 RepID=A0ABU7KIK4_9ACTN|nr:histidine kinase [Nocardiopsis umidischolae]MEE2049125.1 histidine kinase [Nocardiopsis umidischolae]
MGEAAETVSEESGPGRTLVLSVGLTLLFNAVILPEWLRALDGAGSPALRTLAAVLAAAYVVGCAAAVPLAPRLGSTARHLACAALLLLGCALFAVLGLPHSWVLVFGLAVTAAILPLRPTLWATVLAVVGVTAVALATGRVGEQFGNLVIITTVTVATALAVRLVEANAELRRARDQAAQLAVLRERERFARDLHDLLGHSLTTIVLKAGVGRRILESTGDADRAAAELRDLEELGRRSLAEVRAAVSGSHRVTLSAELLRAEAVLRAAGVALELPPGTDVAGPGPGGAAGTTVLRRDGTGASGGADEVLGFVLREAVTNVVRHSGASRVRVALGPGWIEVGDDGRARPGGIVPGGGLLGLEDRVTGAGGVLTVEPRPGGGLTVRAELPAGAGGAGEGDRRTDGAPGARPLAATGDLTGDTGAPGVPPDGAAQDTARDADGGGERG